MKRLLPLTVAALVASSVSGCALTKTSAFDNGPADEGPLKGATFTVASKNFTEQLLLCQLTAQRLAAQAASVKQSCGMSGSNAVRAALTGGSIDMYWEYTGTGWLALKQKDVVTDPQVMYQRLSALDLQQNHVVWLPPAAANNTYALAVKAEKGKELGVATLSDYAKLANSTPAQASFCGASEFLGRDDGWTGLQKAYGFALPKGNTAELSEGPIYNAIDKSNPCNFGEVFATDGRIVTLGLTVLKDDKRYFPPYNLSLTVRQDVLDKTPKLREVMEPVSAALTTEALQKLNAQIDMQGKSPDTVAHQWLSDNHFL